MNVIGSLRKQLSAFDSKGTADEKLGVKVIENQRFNPSTERWSFKNLLATDPKRFSSEIGETDQFPTIPLPAGWEYAGLWEIDYNYHAELSGCDPSGLTKPRTYSEATRSDAPAELDPEEESGEWVYSTSFEDLQRGVVMDSAGSNSVTPLAMSPIAEDYTPEEEEETDGDEDPSAASMRAALDAAYDLPRENMLSDEPVALVRQRRYRRSIVRTKKPGEPATAILSAKGSALVSASNKMLSSTNKFITETAESHKKDIAKLVNVAKDKMASAGKSNNNIDSSVHNSGVSAGQNVNEEEETRGANGADNEGASAASAAGTSPSPVPNISTTTANTGASANKSTPPPRIQSFTSRMFGSLGGNNNSAANNNATTNATNSPSNKGIAADPAATTDSNNSTTLAFTPIPANADNSETTAVSLSASVPDQSVVKNNSIMNANNISTDSLNTAVNMTTPSKSNVSRSRRDTADTNKSGDSNSDTRSTTPIPIATNNTSNSNSNTADTFDMEIDMDGADFENNSEIGDVYSDTMSMHGGNTTDYNPHTVGGVASSNRNTTPVPAAAADKRRSSSYFGSLFGSSTSASTSANPDNNTSTAAPLAPIDPIFKVVSPKLASLGRQLRNVEAQSVKEQENAARDWRHNTKPVLEQEIQALEKQAQALMLQIEREANKGIAHINALEGQLTDINTEMDIKKRKYHLPDSTITVGSGGVYVGVNDFWLQQLSGHFSVLLHPKKDGSPSEISVVLTGKKSPNGSGNTSASGGIHEHDGVTVQFRAEGFKLVGDKGKKVPKLSFDNLRLAVALTLQVTLTFDHLTKKWLLPSKNFNLKILSFKGPYGINRSMVGMILSLVTPMIRTAIITAIPHEVGMLLHSLPTDFTLRGEFDLRGMDVAILSTDFHKCETMQQLSGYGPQQLEMFVLMQRAMERSAVIRNLADLITYRRKYAAHAELYAQLMLIWAECCVVYCEHVITAKMEQLIEQSSGSINPLSMSIRFDVFMNACDDICHKRTTAKCAIQYIDGQISLNELLQFIFQMQHRLASDELPKSSGLRKVRLTTLIESLQAQFGLARSLVALVVQNFDFAHLTIVGDVTSGPYGQANVKVAELLAQMPMSLNLSIMEDKNIGALSLVPYILSFKPQENGDVCLELYSFTQDVALPESNHHTLPITITPKPYDKALQAEQEHQLQQALALEKDTMSQCYSTNYNKLLNAITLNRAVGNSRHHLHPHYDPVSQTVQANTSGKYSGSYSTPQTPTQGGAVSSQYSDTQSEHGNNNSPRSSRRISQPLRRGSHASHTHAAVPHSQPQHSAHPTHSAHSHANAHLSVKHADLRKALTHTLNDYPTGEESDTICTILASNPHISVIVDQAVKLAAGTELLTIIVGPKVKTWKPLGKATLLNEGPGHHDSHNTEPNKNKNDNDTTEGAELENPISKNRILEGTGIGSITSSAGISGASGANNSKQSNSGSVTQEKGEDNEGKDRAESFNFGTARDMGLPEHLGCPIKVQTAPGIKMLTQVEKADVDINLPGLIRFLLAHFRDVPLLKEYLEIFVGGVFMVEHLNIYKILIEKVAKYLLLPGIELDINLNIRIVVKDAQILVRVETPDLVVAVQEQGLDLNADNLARLSNMNTNTATQNAHTTAKEKVTKIPHSAVNLSAELSIKDLVDDISEIMEHVKVFLEPTESDGGRV